MHSGRPNIIFIITDQQRYDTIAAHGFPHMATPVLDGLAAAGASFSRCYVSGASCVPARASLFSGCFPHTTGVINNAAGWRHSWVERFAAAGYRCASVGKMHTQPMDEAAGFHTRLIVENKDRSQAIRGREFVLPAESTLIVSRPAEMPAVVVVHPRLIVAFISNWLTR